MLDWRTLGERLLWCEPIWIALLAPSLLFPGRFWVPEWQPALAALLFVFWPLRLAVRRSPGRPLLFVLPALLLLLPVLAALTTSLLPAVAWEASGYLLLGMAATLALVQWEPVRQRPAIVAWLLLTIGGFLALTGPLLLGQGPDKFGLASLAPSAGGLASALGETINPNVLGGALLIPLLLALALAIGPRWCERPWRWVWAAVAIWLLSVLVLSQCRGAYLGAAGAILLLVVLRWPRAAWIALPVSVLLALLLTSGLSFSLMLDNIAGSTHTNGLTGRLAIWQFAGDLLGRQPLTGAGLGLFAAVQLQSTGAQPASHAHNLLLQVAMDLGLPGAIAYLFLLAGVAAMLVHLLHRRHWRRGELQAGSRQKLAAVVHRRRLHWTLAIGAAAALFAVLVHGLVDAALWGNKVAFMLWLLYALVASLDQNSKETL